MKRLLIPPVAVLLAASVVLGSCDGGPFETEGTAEEAPIHVTAFAIGTPINTIVIEVTAADINQRLVFNLELVEGVASGIIKVPSGEARTFTVTAYDDQHNITHEGSATTDVNPGSNPPLKVKLKPVAGEVEITVTFGDYAVLVAPAVGTVDGTVSSELKLGVKVLDQHGDPILNPLVQWATTDPSIATVSDSGVVTGLADGAVTIVATYEGVAGLSELTLVGFDGSPPPIKPDSYEPNDTWATASYLGSVGHAEYLDATANFHDPTKDSSDFYRIRGNDSGSCQLAEEVFALQVSMLNIPSGSDYDLYFYTDVDSITPVDSATQRGTVDELRDIVWNGVPGVDDSRDWIIEVRHFAGAATSEEYLLIMKFTEICQ